MRHCHRIGKKQGFEQHEERTMSHENIHQLPTCERYSSTARLALPALIALLTFLFSGCTTLPSSEGSADPQFFSPGLSTLNGINTLKVVATDPLTGKVYVGGRFSSINNVSADNIAVFDPVSNEWASLAGGGLKSNTADYSVNAIAFLGRYLYVGGEFSRTSDGITGLNNIARYDLIDKQWSVLPGQGVNGTVNAMIMNGNDLYVGGEMTSTFDLSLAQCPRIVRYHTDTGAWAMVDHGLNGFVYSVAAFAGDVFVGGAFTGDVLGGQSLGHIARYRPATDSFEQLPGGGLDGQVNTIAANTAGLYVGGSFQGTGDGQIFLSNVAFFDSVGWFPFPEDGVNDIVTSIAVLANDVYVGGSFTSSSSGTTVINKVGRMHNNQWFALDGNGLAGPSSSSVEAMAATASDLYMVGNFRWTFDCEALTPCTAGNLNGFARYSPPATPFAENLGTGPIGYIPFNGGIGLNGEVRAIESGPGGMMYVGGDFTQSFDGTLGLNKIARFDPVTRRWSPLAQGGLNGRVRALAVSGNNLYVGGDFTFPAQGGPALNRIARYDLSTNTWSAMPRNGLDNGVYAMKVVGNSLYLGGLFQNTRDFVQRLNLIARYDLTANTWSPLANDGFSGGVVMTLGLHGSDLIVGGYFFGNADGSNQNMRNLIFYNTSTTTWILPANIGLDSFVEVMAIDGDRMMLRGTFQGTADFSIIGFSGLANYDFSTSHWSFVTGNADTRALLLKTNASKRVGNDMYIGGSFTSVGGRLALYFTRIYLQQWGGLAPFAMSTDWFAGANWTTGFPPASGTSVVIPAGTGPIDISSGDVTLEDLMLNGGSLIVGAGRTLTINGTLSLSGGKISGPGSVIVTRCKPDAVMFGGSNSYVEAALTRCVNDVGPYNFDIGTANGYSPITIKNVTGAGNVSVKPNQGAYSGPATGLPANRLARWWQIENPGGGVTNANLFFGYLDSDVSGIEANYGAYRISGGIASGLTSIVNTFSNTVNAPNVTGFSDWTLAELIPTAANASVGGRVITAAGNGIGKTVVTLTDQSGNARTLLTNTFGYYRFDEVEVGQTYVVAAQNKRFQFASPTKIISVRSDVTDADFVSSP